MMPNIMVVCISGMLRVSNLLFTLRKGRTELNPLRRNIIKDLARLLLGEAEMETKYFLKLSFLFRSIRPVFERNYQAL